MHINIYAKTYNMITKWAKILNRQFSREDIHMFNRYMKKIFNMIVR